MQKVQLSVTEIFLQNRGVLSLLLCIAKPTNCKNVKDNKSIRIYVATFHTIQSCFSSHYHVCVTSVSLREEIRIKKFIFIADKNIKKPTFTWTFQFNNRDCYLLLFN